MCLLYVTTVSASAMCVGEEVQPIESVIHHEPVKPAVRAQKGAARGEACRTGLLDRVDLPGNNLPLRYRQLIQGLVQGLPGENMHECVFPQWMFQTPIYVHMLVRCVCVYISAAKKKTFPTGMIFDHYSASHIEHLGSFVNAAQLGIQSNDHPARQYQFKYSASGCQRPMLL